MVTTENGKIKIYVSDRRADVDKLREEIYARGDIAVVFSMVAGNVHTEFPRGEIIEVVKQGERILCN
jgi:hypothetical protein